MKYFIFILFTFITISAQANITCKSDSESHSSYKIVISSFDKFAVVTINGENKDPLICEAKWSGWDDNYPTSIECKTKDSYFNQLVIHPNFSSGEGSGFYHLNFDEKIRVECSSS